MPVPAGSTPPAPPSSGPLVYDPVLSRVRVSLSLPDTVPVTDLFSRTVSPGWGTATSGQVWGSTDPVFSTVGFAGRSTHAATGAVRNVLGGTSAVTDVTAVATVTISQKLTGAGAMFPGWILRLVDGSNFYKFGLLYQASGVSPGQVGVAIGKTVGGGFVPLFVSSGTFDLYNGSETFWLKAECAGSTLRVKVWRTTELEPVAWTATVVDSTFTVGSVGVESTREPGVTNVSPFIQWDDVSVVPTVRVERSTDLVRWSTVRGGGAMVVADGTLRIDDYEFAPDVPNHYRAGGFTGSIVPQIGGVWLKSLARPFLNRQVTVRDFSEVSRPSRAGVFDVVGRSYPVAVTDVRGSRRWSLDVSTYSARERSDLDLLLASGDILLVQVPADGSRLSATPGGYVTVGDSREVTPPTVDLLMRVFTLPCTQVAAPGPDVVGATITCQGLLDAYATCAAVLVAHPTCVSVLELIGDPTDVVVP